ncbi:hypothetical protein KIH74_29040 [Kineosporia sp. J2-2]|uniref:DUF5666 domain-containing protein n=1 Tax=Kineosporia corallincola TaxID=2835133 RepID=A0ABS5TQU7_9ACTN|nr:DUF5666 domain-containing protein [Kineosporia corallincola]MBT0773024.1 hypothetical protein [Kineosporia corallincola]
MNSSRTADSTAPAGLDRTAVQPPVGQAPGHPGQWAAAAPVQPVDDDLDLLAESGRKVGKVTLALAAAVLVGVAFIGGVVVQKQWGSSNSGSPGGMSAMGGGSAEGMGGSGGFPGGAGVYGASGMNSGGRGRDSSSESQDSGTGSASGGSSTPVVVGTVTKVSGRTLTVKNFAGTSVTVKVPAGTTITDSSDGALDGLAKGASVSVAGTTADDGTVTATAVTVS